MSLAKLSRSAALSAALEVSKEPGVSQPLYKAIVSGVLKVDGSISPGLVSVLVL